MDSSFNLRIFQPKGQLSAYVQGVWSASVSPHGSNDIKRWLYSDGGSGILFNFSRAIYLGDTQFNSGVVLLPVSKQAHSITLSPGSQLAGLRFHPAIGFGIFGERYDQPTAIDAEDDVPFALHSLFGQLMDTPGHYARISALYRWLKKELDFSNVIPTSLEQALGAVQRSKTPGQLSEDIPLSQRQLERQFQRWLGMTPKHYQRIVRVKKTLIFLKHNPDVDLVGLALNNGFTDQAHMTREFKQIAKITPRQYSKLVACHPS